MFDFTLQFFKSKYLSQQVAKFFVVPIEKFLHLSLQKELG